MPKVRQEYPNPAATAHPATATPIAAAPGGIVAGAAPGGIAAGLVGVGIPEIEAKA